MDPPLVRRHYVSLVSLFTFRLPSVGWCLPSIFHSILINLNPLTRLQLSSMFSLYLDLRCLLFLLDAAGRSVLVTSRV